MQSDRFLIGLGNRFPIESLDRFLIQGITSHVPIGTHQFPIGALLLFSLGLLREINSKLFKIKINVHYHNRWHTTE